MTWGPCIFYYHCSECGKKFSYAADLMAAFGDNFGKCPNCGAEGIYEKDGARILKDREYEEVE